MDTTAFLAMLWGPTFLALGIGFFVSKTYYLQLYRNLEKQMLAILLLAIIAIPLGIIHIMIHNVWEDIASSVVSLLGWLLLAKGIAAAIAPKLVDQAGDYEVKHGFIPKAGYILLILGAYLTWYAYLS